MSDLHIKFAPIRIIAGISAMAIQSGVRRIKCYILENAQDLIDAAYSRIVTEVVYIRL